jgi:hypothetical protein
VGVEGVTEAVGLGGDLEVELREEGPDAAPAAGEDAGSGGDGGAEAEEDEDEDVIGERAEGVLAAAPPPTASPEESFARLGAPSPSPPLSSIRSGERNGIEWNFRISM